PVRAHGSATSASTWPRTTYCAPVRATYTVKRPGLPVGVASVSSRARSSHSGVRVQVRSTSLRSTSATGIVNCAANGTAGYSPRGAGATAPEAEACPEASTLLRAMSLRGRRAASALGDILLAPQKIGSDE